MLSWRGLNERLAQVRSWRKADEAVPDSAIVPIKENVESSNNQKII